MQDELAQLSLTEARRALARGSLCPVEYVDALLARIAERDGEIHAFIHLEAESARRRARKLRDRRRRRDVLPRLFGIPYAVKDILKAQGIATTCNSRIMSTSPADRSARVVELLNRAGAICVGTLGLTEFAIGEASADLPWPPVVNPLNPAYVVGSSSSGCGAAVAARFVPLAVGTDTGGSVRGPAMMNGVVGLKPTYGAVSCDGVFPLSRTMDTVGLLAQSVEDLSAATDVVLESADVVAPRFRKPLQIGVIRHLFAEDLECAADVSRAINGALDKLISAGASIADVRVRPLEEFNAVGWTILLAEAFAIHRKWLESRPQEYGASAREKLFSGAYIRAADYLLAQHNRRALVESIDRALGEVDVLVTATSAVPPCRVDDDQAITKLIRSSVRMPFNVTGHPALGIPIDLSGDRMPIAMQVIARHRTDRVLIRIGKWLQQAIGYDRPL